MLNCMFFENFEKKISKFLKKKKLKIFEKKSVIIQRYSKLFRYKTEPESINLLTAFMLCTFLTVQGHLFGLFRLIPVKCLSKTLVYLIYIIYQVITRK